MALRKININFFFKLLKHIVLNKSIKKQFMSFDVVLIYCFSFVYYFLYKTNNNVIYFFKNDFYKYGFSLGKQLKHLTKFVAAADIKKFFYIKYSYNGLGYKIFLYKQHLYILVGLSHYILLLIPNTISFFIKCKKRKFFILSSNFFFLQELKFKIFLLQRLNLYKVRGLFYFKTLFIKKYICFKKGKKQQFM